jgi:hypothetical protein
MSKISCKNPAMITDISKELIEFESFLEFYESCQYQTKNLMRKKEMRLCETLNDEILTFKMSNSTCMDDSFFKSMGDIQRSTESDGIPVIYKSELKCLEVDWLMNSENGRDFMNTILSYDSSDVYEN